MVIVTHTTCKSQGSLWQHFRIREGFGTNTRTKKKRRRRKKEKKLHLNIFVTWHVCTNDGLNQIKSSAQFQFQNLVSVQQICETRARHGAVGVFNLQHADSQIILNQWWNYNMRQHTVKHSSLCAHCHHYEWAWRKHVYIYSINN